MQQSFKPADSKNTAYQFLYTALSVYLVILLLRYPKLSLDYAAVGLSLWFERMIPTLLPFMILSGIMIRMNLTEQFVRLLHPLLHRLFGTTPNGSYTILMGFLCGFPMGARIIGELLENGKLSEPEAAYLLSFCNNIGPIYFLSFVVSVLEIRKPAIPFLAMYGIPLLYGFFLYRFSYRRKGGFLTPSGQSAPARAIQTPTLLSAVDASVLSGLIGIAKLGGYMVFFNLLNIITVPFKHLPKNLLFFYNCLLEITSGISRSGRFFALPILILLPFGGFSCIAQTYSMIHHTRLSIQSYVFHKILQTAITLAFYVFYAFCVS